MSMPELPQWLVRLAVVVAVPTIACFGYYALADLGAERSSWAVPVVLAYPTALIGLVGLAGALMAPQRSRAKLWLSALLFVVAALFLVLVRA